ncbi:related to vegetatible incompatibility protein HET-E-1 [Rhynchosporium agropyri]|uniref:Related to vegetatible incompatibility protein HET-E-1 n=1 Tax=Rhynchosporium agropyri TaxID=914238 RepID=A0A1E1LN64_9HELO|nr:related to vegetatible incompatibility protein HET-E-1 [Rhynchosporium agropyri]
MPSIKDFEASRLENINRNGALLETLGVNQQAKSIREGAEITPPAKKRRKIEKTNLTPRPSRSSARIASAPSQPIYDKNKLERLPVKETKSRTNVGKGGRPALRKEEEEEEEGHKPTVPIQNLEELQESWTAWQPVAPAPSRDEAGVFRFESHRDFTPNKSPEEMLREGCFGGSYFRPLYSKHLGITIQDDYRELPASWIDGLNIDTYLTSPIYDPDINKYKVACGQTIEQWEQAGWINHTYDVRGWFQWYCRFYMGRRCPDDDRQVSRWKKCVGATGRWRRMLLKKYTSAGVRDVFDDGEEEDQIEVSPVMHQTCHHWAFCVTQEVLDEYWRTGK